MSEYVLNYYQFHIGDFRSGTVNMTRQARWIYRDMIDVYYDTESPLPLDFDVLCDLIGVELDDERAIVSRLLRFKFEKTDGGYRHEICDQVIEEYRVKADIAKANGRRGGRPIGSNKPSGFQSGFDQDANGNQEQTGSEANQEPLTNNHKPKKSKPKASPATPLPDWVPADAFADFVAMRKAIKKQITDEGIRLAIKKLDALRSTGSDPLAVLEQSTLHSWQGLFEVKSQNRGPPAYQTANDKAKNIADRLTGKNRNEPPDIIDINEPTS